MEALRNSRASKPFADEGTVCCEAYSITRRLIVTVLLVELFAALSISGAAMLYERHVRFRSFDVMLRGRADSLLGAVQDAEDAQDNVMLDGTEVSLPTEDIYQVKTRRPHPGTFAKWTGPEGSLPRHEKRASLSESRSATRIIGR